MSNNLNGNETFSLCMDCASTVAKGCVHCDSKVSPSKFKLQSRSCEKCIVLSQGFTNVEPYTDTIFIPDAAGSEMVCSHEDLLPMVMGYKKNSDGHTAAYYGA